MQKRLNLGFTLIELMMVVVVLGILTSLGAVRYVDTMRKANEGATKGNLGALRSAMGVYYADVLTQYPTSLARLAENEELLKLIPSTKIQPYHSASNASKEGAVAGLLDDGGGWAYVNAPQDANYGKIWINCTHTDVTGKVWTTY